LREEAIIEASVEELADIFRNRRHEWDPWTVQMKELERIDANTWVYYLKINTPAVLLDFKLKIHTLAESYYQEERFYYL
jgi:hypothetical protein